MKITISPEDINCFVWEGNEDYELIEEGDFTQEGKYQFAENIYKHTITGKYYMLNISRSGSYHSDWYYDYEDTKSLDLYEVEKIEVVTHEWKAV